MQLRPLAEPGQTSFFQEAKSTRKNHLQNFQVSSRHGFSTDDVAYRVGQDFLVKFPRPLPMESHDQFRL
jgi:hypothetical protein